MAKVLSQVKVLTKALARIAPLPLASFLGQRYLPPTSWGDKGSFLLPPQRVVRGQLQPKANTRAPLPLASYLGRRGDKGSFLLPPQAGGGDHERSEW